MIQVQTFGAVELRRDGTEVRSVLSQPKRLALFVHLLLGSPSGYLNRDAVLARFWPDADAERARNSLRQALHYLRRSLGEDAIENRGDEIGCPAGVVKCDALEFERALEGGRLEEAMRYYRGDFLPAFFVDDAPEIESWVDAQRTWYRRQAFRTASALAERDGAAGELKAGVLWARQACVIDPHDEAAARRLIQLLAQAGEAAGALAEYEEFETRLRREHEIEPSEETRSLAASIRRAAARPVVAENAASIRRGEATLPGGEAAASMHHADATSESTETISSDAGPAAAATPGASAAAAASTPDVSRPPLSTAPRRGSIRRRYVQIAAAIVVLLTGAGWYARSLKATPDAALAVAVLPFANRSGDPADDYLADGLAEELLSVLTRVPGLKVAARTSSFSFKGKDVSIDSIARALNVTHVLEGSVRVAGSRLRIAVQLIEAGSGFHAWSDSYDRDAADIAAVQDEISSAIAKSLQVQLSPAIASPPASETRDAEAYRLLLRANQMSRSGSTRETLGEARALLEEALRRDPRYPRALAALASVLSWQANFRYIDADSGYARARELAMQALEIAPMVEAHLVLARAAEMVQWDTAAADEHYRKALEINPSDPRTLQFRAVFLAGIGRVEEGIAAARRAIELDPLHPGAYNNLAITLLAAERLVEAQEAYTQALRVSPEDPVILGNLANLMARQERWDEAMTWLDRALVRTPDDVQTLAQRTSILLRSGRHDEGMAMLKELEASPDFPRYRLAILYTNIGDIEKILDMLEQAVERREPGAMALRSPDAFKGLRQHPRFLKLLEQIDDRP